MTDIEKIISRLEAIESEIENIKYKLENLDKYTIDDIRRDIDSIYDRMN